jgi:hypothetical protein
VARTWRWRPRASCCARRATRSSPTPRPTPRRPPPRSPPWPWPPGTPPLPVGSRGGARGPAGRRARAQHLVRPLPRHPPGHPRDGCPGRADPAQLPGRVRGRDPVPRRRTVRAVRRRPPLARGRAPLLPRLASPVRGRGRHDRAPGPARDLGARRRPLPDADRVRPAAVHRRWSAGRPADRQVELGRRPRPPSAASLRIPAGPVRGAALGGEGGRAVAGGLADGTADPRAGGGRGGAARGRAAPRRPRAGPVHRAAATRGGDRHDAARACPGLPVDLVRGSGARRVGGGSCWDAGLAQRPRGDGGPVRPRRRGAHVPPGDITGTAAALGRLADDRFVDDQGRALRRRFEERYTHAVARERLETVYREVVAARDR